MTPEKRKLHISRQSTVFACLFVLALAFLLWKCPYGFGGSDEAFYLTVPHRLCLGDRLFADEWHLSQLSAFFTLPFVWCYRHLVGSNDGILLAARYVYVCVHAAAALWVYLRLRKLTPAAIPAALVFLVFTPFEMMCYSYNTVAVDALTLAGVLAGTAAEKGRAAYVAAGAFFACAVVCCPYLAAVYLLYLLCTALYAACGRRTGRPLWHNALFSWRAFGLFSAGILIPLALFALFFFRFSSVQALLGALPGLFTDPEHPAYSAVFMLKHYLYCILTAHRLLPLPLGLYALTLVLLVLDRQRREHAALHLALAAAVTLWCFALLLGAREGRCENAAMFPLVLMGFTAYLLLEQKPRMLFGACFVPSLLYSVCVGASSNMGFAVISMACTGASVAAIVFLGQLAGELRRRRSAAVGIAAALAPVLCLLVFVTGIKATHCFWDASPLALRSKITDGPARGIVTSQRLAEDYTRIYDDLRSYDTKPRGNLLVYAQETWCYLILDDYPYAGFSAWLSGTEERTAQRLALYYRVNPQKRPQYVYILKNTAFAQPNLDASAVLDAAGENGFSVEENELSWKLERTEPLPS